MLKLPPDVLLLRWVNYHLAQAGNPRRIKNFSGDINDSEVRLVAQKGKLERHWKSPVPASPSDVRC